MVSRESPLNVHMGTQFCLIDHTFRISSGWIGLLASKAGHTSRTEGIGLTSSYSCSSRDRGEEKFILLFRVGCACACGQGSEAAKCTVLRWVCVHPSTRWVPGCHTIPLACLPRNDTTLGLSEVHLFLAPLLPLLLWGQHNFYHLLKLRCWNSV